MSERLLERVRAARERPDADDVLREAVAALADEPGVVWAGIRFVEGGELVLGPAAGEPDPSRRTAIPIVYEGDPVGELLVDGWYEPDALEAVARELSAYVLLGWDTFGEAWEA